MFSCYQMSPKQYNYAINYAIIIYNYVIMQYHQQLFLKKPFRNQTTKPKINACWLLLTRLCSLELNCLAVVLNFKKCIRSALKVYTIYGDI